jgi:hypothetical protein
MKKQVTIGITIRIGNWQNSLKRENFSLLIACCLLLISICCNDKKEDHSQLSNK